MHLTNKSNKSDSVSVASVHAESAGAPAEDEIEITPEMIAAGVEILEDYFYAELLESAVSPKAICNELFRAMASRRKSS